jgi:hypothetical protein
MTTVAELEARLDALNTQRDSAGARVSYDGRSVEYRGTAEIARSPSWNVSCRRCRARCPSGMLHVQSNPLPICTRPRVLIKGKRT